MTGVTFYVYCNTLDSGFSFVYIRHFGNNLYSLRRVTVFMNLKKKFVYFKNIRTRMDCNWDILNIARLVPSRNIPGSSQKFCLFSKKFQTGFESHPV
jgi:hypothetical protein